MPHDVSGPLALLREGDAEVHQSAEDTRGTGQTQLFEGAS